MKIRTQMTVNLLAGFLALLTLFILLAGQLLINTREANLKLFKSELLEENTRLLEDSSVLFFNLVTDKFLAGYSREDVLVYIKEIDELHRSVVVVDFNGRSMLPGHSREDLLALLSKDIIVKELDALARINKKNFSLDNFQPFMAASTDVVPRQIYCQIFYAAGYIIGYGRTMEHAKQRLVFLERRNTDRFNTLLHMTFLVIGTGVLALTVFTWLGAYRAVFAPLERLNESFDRVAGGDLGHRAGADAGPEIAHLAESFNSMTERLNQSVHQLKAANIKLDNHSKNLELRVSRRTRELSETVGKLDKARLDAESANRAKSRFLANMSHEIRTPMNAVLGMTELVLETPLSPEQEEYIRTVKNSADSLLDILNDILDFSKIETGQLDMDPIRFDPRELIKNTIKHLSLKAEAKGPALTYTVSEDIPPLLVGPAGRLRQVLTNLVGNALKFTHTGTIHVEVETDTHGAAGLETGETALRFSVSDTGIGIPEDKQGMIFDKFTQKDGSITRPFGGAGLGLAICRHLVHLMRGGISVKSPGRLAGTVPGSPGSTFCFSVVLNTTEPEPAGRRSINRRPGDGESVDNPATAPAAGLKALKVLVAEDNVINQKVILRMLETSGAAVTIAPDGKAAIQCYLKEPYDIILMDIQMPVMDGLQATREIRRREALGDNPRRIPIVAVTAHAIKGDRERFIEAGVDTYLSKPIKKSVLLETMETLLKSRDQG